MPKYLLPKYFYDEKGSAIFQDIMKMPEYYLTACEMEIFDKQNKQICHSFLQTSSSFDLIELGSGDGLKTRILLNSLVKSDPGIRYIPVDISEDANKGLISKLALEIPGLSVEPLTGDFFRLEKQISETAGKRKVILFLGSNIGNFTDTELKDFLVLLAGTCSSGDRVLTGFDLKKSPQVIMKAYNDPYGHTRRFNLNHLVRLNRELEADFNTVNFEHHTTYNPVSGEVKSYLVSLKEQTVNFGSGGHSFSFGKWEPIFMERSRKFDFETIENLADHHGFKVLNHFTDSKNWFTDSLWEKL